jgi:hypothetical protein
MKREEVSSVEALLVEGGLEEEQEAKEEEVAGMALAVVLVLVGESEAGAACCSGRCSMCVGVDG